MARFRYYALADPRNGAVRYVGRTTRTLKKRFGSGKGFNTRVRAWIDELAAAGMKPKMFLLERSNVPDRERFWISFYTSHGKAPMLNATDDGLCSAQRVQMNREKVRTM